MKPDKVITDTIKVLSQFKPRSIFVYGSRGRDDSMPTSDYEIGVIFDDASYVRRSIIHLAIENPIVRVYPFKMSELESGTIDTPFQKTIYLRELVLAGKTVEGEDVIGKLTPPPIKTIDLIQRVRFDLGQALAAVFSMRSGDTVLGLEEFSKSCLFGLRCLGIFELGEFSVGYDAIYKLKDKLSIEEKYRHVIDAAYGLRHGQTEISTSMVFENISFLNSLVETEIMKSFESKGNEVLCP